MNENKIKSTYDTLNNIENKKRKESIYSDYK